MIKKVTAILVTTFFSSIATAEITVNGNTISWPGGGWYHVQDENNGYATICEGTRSCKVEDGRYLVTNHKTGDKYRNIDVPKRTEDDNNEGGVPRVEGFTIKWPDNDEWYHVQDASYNSICQGGTSCTVEAGVYLVTNHSINKKYRGIVVPNFDDGGNAEEREDGVDFQLPSPGYYQLQSRDTFETLCETGSPCIGPVVDGTYILVDLKKPFGDLLHKQIVVVRNGVTVGFAPIDEPNELDTQPDDENVFPVNPKSLSGAQFAYEENRKSLSFFDSKLTDNVNELDPKNEFYQQPHGGTPGVNGVGGSVGDGSFRVTCQWSHFNYDDPIRKQGEKNASHLHMYFGNTSANANTSSQKSSDSFVADSGGGSCSGFGLNRSAYWVPALMANSNTAVVPETILVYYKTRTVCKDRGAQGPSCEKYSDGSEPFRPGPGKHHTANDVEYLPQGLEMVSGWKVGENLNDLAANGDLSPHVFWSCGYSGKKTTKFNSIPNKDQWQACIEKTIKDYDYGDATSEERDQKEDEIKAKFRLNATIYFQQCWAPKKDGSDLLSSDKGRSPHVLQVEPVDACPDNPDDPEKPYFPRRLPRIGFLLYWKIAEGESPDGWFLSSDKDSNGIMSGNPGGTLHGDLIAGWDTETMVTWTDLCLKGKKSCGFGQTGAPQKLKHDSIYMGDSTGSYMVTIPPKP